jgi:alkanesulfonate monooxygenase SsuD/methylene tetrahydromethanopterin reductase-like flavin-dependent oxidoreductase (luciferase family)
VTNYGHDLRFGVEIFGAAEAPGKAVETALQAERLGYDLVAFPEPEDEGDVDGVTFAAWTAARTTTVQVGASRLHATVRPASVVARGALSLQLLSGGRAMLVLGTGAAAGDVEVVEEAVAVIRALQDSARGAIDLPGTHHRLAGAEPGPAVEREVPVWLAGSTVAVADLAGRVADGLMVDLDAVGVDGLAQLNEVVDRAATQAGRDVR